MRQLFRLALLLICTTPLFSQLTVEKIMQDPSKWIGTSPSNISWSEDSKTVYFNWNPEQNPSDSLYKMSIEDLTPIKMTADEKMSMPSSFGEAYSKDRQKKLYFKNGNIFLLDKTNGTERQLSSTLGRKSGLAFSGDETAIVYTENNNLFVMDLSTGLVSQLTDFGNESRRPPGGKVNANDEMLMKDQLELFDVLRERKQDRENRDKYHKEHLVKGPKALSTEGKSLQALQISPDMRFITYRLMEAAKGVKNTFVPSYVTESGYTEQLNARSKVGSPLAVFESFIYDTQTDTVYKISTKDIPGIKDMPEFLNEYPKDTSSTKKTPAREVAINGPMWSPEGNHAIVVIRSLDNKDRWIMELDPSTGKLSLLDRQRDEAWISGPGIGFSMSMGNVGYLDDSHFFYQSEADGYSHLYTIDLDTKDKIQLTKGKYEVKSAALSMDKKSFYLTTNEVHPGETHFYKLSIDGKVKTKLTSMEGGNEIDMSPDEKMLAIRYSNTNTPWELYIQENKEGATAKKITASTTAEFQAYSWKKPEIITFKARDGQDIYARIYSPNKKVKNGKAVIFVHGAGYLQNAHKWWSSYFREYMFHNLLVDKGYTVLDMDYRASAGYGRDVRTGIYRFMGGKDLTDNVDGAEFLVKKHGIKADKIGIYGGSYGGFITLMAMFTTPDVFAAGAALRPVTDWAAYNHGYTSDILNEPQTDSIAYRRSSPIFHADGLKGNLLICHGMIDVNVHIQDSYRLVQKLIELKKENWEMASYPLEDHGFVEPTSWMDEYKRILKLFEEKL